MKINLIGVVESPNCTFCQEAAESVEHLLFYRISSDFWKHVLSWLRDGDVHVETINESDVIFRKFDIVEDYILINLSIYTLNDLGDLSNVIGSLSRSIQQYSPPSEWIMCELGVLPIFLENDQNPKADFFLRQEKTWNDSIRRFSIYCSRVFCSIAWIVYNSLCSRRRSRFVNSAFSNKKIFAKKSKFIYDKQI